MTQRDDQRNERINMEIIVDAYTQEEQAMGWHIYLEETQGVIEQFAYCSFQQFQKQIDW